jgi:hypothetical protein
MIFGQLDICINQLKMCFKEFKDTIMCDTPPPLLTSFMSSQWIHHHVGNLSPNGSINVVATSSNANHHMEENLDLKTMFSNFSPNFSINVVASSNAHHHMEEEEEKEEKEDLKITYISFFPCSLDALMLLLCQAM